MWGIYKWSYDLLVCRMVEHRWNKVVCFFFFFYYYYFFFFYFFFFFNDTATTEIYTLSLHDALPIWFDWLDWLQYNTTFILCQDDFWNANFCITLKYHILTRNVTFLTRNVTWWYRSEEHTSELQSQSTISYAVFCLKKKKKKTNKKHF